MTEELQKKLNRLMKRYTYLTTSGKEVIYIPLKKLKKLSADFKVSENYLIKNGCKIVDTYWFETVDKYDNEELIAENARIMHEIGGANIIISEKRKNFIISKIEEIAKDSHYPTDFQCDDIIIPHHELLYLGLMPWELEFAYDYIIKNQYTIRGINSTMEDNFFNFSRCRKNKRYTDDRLTSPYSKIRRKRKLKELADLKIEIDELRSVVETTDDIKLKVKFKILEDKYFALRNDLLEHSIRLVYKFMIKNKWFFYHSTLSILYECYINGFDKYIEGYYYRENNCPSSVFELSTWLFQCFLRSDRFFNKDKNIIYLPDHQTESIKKVKKVKKWLEREMGERYTIEDIADQMDLTPKSVNELLELDKPIESIEQIIEQSLLSSFGDEYVDSHGLGLNVFTDFYSNNGMLFDTLEFEEIVKVLGVCDVEVYDENVGQKNLELNELKCLFNDVISELSERRQEVLRLGFGLDDDNPRPLEEIAIEVGLTSEHVRRIKNKCLGKLRSNHKVLNYEKYNC